MLSYESAQLRVDLLNCRNLRSYFRIRISSSDKLLSGLGRWLLTHKLTHSSSCRIGNVGFCLWLQMLSHSSPGHRFLFSFTHQHQLWRRPALVVNLRGRRESSTRANSSIQLLHGFTQRPLHPLSNPSTSVMAVCVSVCGQQQHDCQLPDTHTVREAV